VILGVVAAGGAGSALAAYRYERAHDSRILPGIKVAGVDVGGLTRPQALRAVQPRVDRILSRSITIKAGHHTRGMRLSALGLTASPAAAVDRALGVADTYSWAARVYHRLTDKPVDQSFAVGFHFDGRHVHQLVNKLAAKVAKPASNAAINYVSEQKVAFVHAHTGVAVKKWVAWKRLEAAVERHRAATVRFPMKVVRPKVSNQSLGETIIVNRTTNMLTLYKGFRVLRRYPVATARPGFLTPPGTWHVINKQENPTWINPAPNGWGAGEPLTIPPGPGNPIGTRALYLSAPGILIHGTPEDSSVGTYASHGCIRMHIPDSEAMYPLVPIGTKVIIMGAPPWGDSTPTQPAG
jgi:lipoprotein-anchoring transpeptidase ErfK/SrfK